MRRVSSALLVLIITGSLACSGAASLTGPEGALRVTTSGQEPASNNRAGSITLSGQELASSISMTSLIGQEPSSNNGVAATRQQGQEPSSNN
jgi:hypothetical protein